MPPHAASAGLCRFSESLGRAGEGFHRPRIPGTDSALLDVAGTLAAAWALSAACGWRFSAVAAALFAAAEVLHSVFCVRVGTRGPAARP